MGTDIVSESIQNDINNDHVHNEYDTSCYHEDGSFDINLYFNWNIDCIESDCTYNVYIFHRTHGQKIEVFQDINNYNHATFRILPLQNYEKKTNRKRHCEQQQNNTAKRRKLNDQTMQHQNEEKQELEHKENDNKPLQKRFKHKTSNRNKNKLIQRA